MGIFYYLINWIVPAWKQNKVNILINNRGAEEEKMIPIAEYMDHSDFGYRSRDKG